MDPEPASQNNADPDLQSGSLMMILFFCLFRFGRNIFYAVLEPVGLEVIFFL